MLWYLEKTRKALNVLMVSSLPCVFSRISSPSQTTLLIIGAWSSDWSPLKSKCQVPDSPQNFSNKIITSSYRTRDHLIPLLLQSLPPLALDSSLFPGIIPVCLCMVLCPPSPRLWVYVTNKLLLISCVQCQVSRVQPSLNTTAGILPSLTSWKESNQNTTFQSV